MASRQCRRSRLRAPNAGHRGALRVTARCIRAYHATRWPSMERSQHVCATSGLALLTHTRSSKIPQEGQGVPQVEQAPRIMVPGVRVCDTEDCGMQPHVLSPVRQPLLLPLRGGIGRRGRGAGCARLPKGACGSTSHMPAGALVHDWQTVSIRCTSDVFWHGICHSAFLRLIAWCE
jgi:hypothetical protein